MLAVQVSGQGDPIVFLHAGVADRRDRGEDSKDRSLIECDWSAAAGAHPIMVITSN